MRPKAISIAAASAAVLVSGIFCSSGNNIISDNIANAEIQTRLLLEASEAGDTIRIPSSFQKGEVVFVPASDWVSGFFAGTLWYMYELTGDEFWAEHARKHTEALEDIQYLTWHHDVGFMIYDSYGNGDTKMSASMRRSPCRQGSVLEPEYSSHGMRTADGSLKEGGSAPSS